MAQNYILLETIELNQSAVSVTFDNIPQSGYTDLKIVMSARSTANGGQNANLKLNSITSGYSDRILSGDGSGASSFTSGNTAKGGSCVVSGADFTANTFSNGEIYIPNYLGSTAKSFSSDSVSENNTTLSYQQFHANLCTSTQAISSIFIDLSSGSFAANSTFSLYGIAKLNVEPTIAPLAIGGNIVANDGTYWYHAFLSSGTFTPSKDLSCDMLVIAGGGGGASNGGGGGAGGLLAHVAQALTIQNYNVAIGGGGSGGGPGTDGANSQFGSLTASVGGGGGMSFGFSLGGKAGGSGGGAPRAFVSVGGAANPSGQGNKGGDCTNSSFGSGGGGGAGAAGGDGSGSGVAGNGGNGSSAYSAWGSATSTGQNISGTFWYAGGGGGGSANPQVAGSPGAAGNGGGGAGNSQSGSGGTGIVNTGGGGGGSGATPGGGGSGIVIVRYPMSS
jgi:hypothetical protein